MKFKYFLRGLGFGIVFAAIVCLTAYQGNTDKGMTDEEVIRRAKELGMVEQEDQVGKLLGIDKQNEKSEDESSKEAPQNETEALNQENNSENQSKQTEKKVSTNVESTQKDAKKENRTSEQEEKKTESSTEKKDKTVEKKSGKKEKTVKITIKRGDSSFPVCEKLQELGIIENAAEFDTYLVENGYASRIRVGEHSLKKGMSYHDIAEAISDPL